ncbi:MAG TPA: DNA-processing protein DprA [Terriglobia bacterium]|nr:DNA-processing protein DprA [Terriglobia bacterium]
MDEGIEFWVGLTRVEGLGVRGAHKLIAHFGSPQAAYMAPLTELEASGLPAAVCQAVFTQAGLKEAEREIKEVAKADCQLLAYSSEAYPPILKQLAAPPLFLYVRGDVRVLSEHSLAVVGSRRPSAYGLQVARRLAHDLAERSLVIVSGLARGIDSAAHHGALEAKGKTVAVQGRGMDAVYPTENRRLAEKIAESGAVVSEFPLGTSPTPENFPIRNRIISGLSLGVLVVEASEYSGSLITARLATEQNREVFAVPGNITTAQSFGPNQLIKQGAKLVDQWMDIVEEFPPEVRMQLLPSGEALEAEQAAAGPGELFERSLTAEQKAVFEALRVDEALFVDAILGSVALPQGKVLQVLLELEMSGLIRQLPGKNFIRKL